MRVRALLILALAAGLGCATHRRAVTPEVSRAGEPPPDVSFSSNGCTGFREARFFSCCYVHDFDFWAGGTHRDRLSADLRLRRCVLDASGDERPTADVAFFLIRLEALLGLVIDDGWGRAWRGWPGRRFDPLAPAQRAIVSRERRRVCAELVFNPATGAYRLGDGRELRAADARGFCSDLARDSP